MLRGDVDDLEKWRRLRDSAEETVVNEIDVDTILAILWLR